MIKKHVSLKPYNTFGVDVSAKAFASVEYIMTEVNFGWLIRSVHRWSASMMVLNMILHVCRVYLTGGFKKPRELTWVTGVLLASVTVSFGVTGYSLPWDQVGYLSLIHI